MRADQCPSMFPCGVACVSSQVVLPLSCAVFLKSVAFGPPVQFTSFVLMQEIRCWFRRRTNDAPPESREQVNPIRRPDPAKPIWLEVNM